MKRFTRWITAVSLLLLLLQAAGANTITQKDSLAESTVGVPLASHTPTGAGATGAAWTKVLGATNDFVSLISNGGYTGIVSQASLDAQTTATAPTNGNYVQATVNFFTNAGYGGVLLYDTVSGHAYAFIHVGGGNTYELLYYTNVSTAVVISGPLPGSGAAAFATGSPLAFKLTRNGTSFVGTVNDVTVCSATDASSTGPMVGGLHGFTANVNTYTAFEAGTTSGGALSVSTISNVVKQIDRVSASVFPSGGTAPYTYQWRSSLTSGGSTSNYGTSAPTQTLSSLTAGATRYLTCIVTDSVSATVTSSELAVTLPDSVVVFDGNSKVSGYPGVGTPSAMYPGPNPMVAGQDTSFPAQTMSFLPSNWVGYNYSYASRPLASTASDTNATGHTQQADFSTNIAPIISTAITAGASHIVVCMGEEPGNLLYYCTLNGGAGGTLARNAAVSALQTYAATVRTAGAKFALMSMSRRTLSGASNSNLIADMAYINGWERINWPSIAQGFADLDGDVRMQNTSNLTYFQADGTHLQTAGYLVGAYYAAAAVLQAAGNPSFPTGTSVRPINGGPVHK